MAYKKIKNLLHLALLLTLFLIIGTSLNAGVIDHKTLNRPAEGIVVTGNQMTSYYGLQINPTDATLSPNQIFVWAYDEGTGWRQVVFQIDEINNTYPSSPPPICTNGSHVGLGPNHMQPDDNLWDSNDELVFMSDETGDRVSADEWAPDANTTSPRYEVLVTDPLDSSKKGWVYIFKYDTLPVWRTDDYVSWNESSNTVTAKSYTVDYPDNHQSALYFQTLTVTPSGGGTGSNLVQSSKWSWNGGFSLNCTSSETQIRTEQTITGGGCEEMILPWYAKDGRVRVLRYFIWSPYCTWVTNGIGMWPCVHHYYYKSYWKEDHADKFHGGSGHTNYWFSTINHSSAVNMTFYDSNGETATINGTGDTIAATPLWKWYQVSSSYGSYIKTLRNTAKQVSPDNRKNLYTDSGTGNRGNAGYHIEDPTETTENAWHNFYFFFLPATAPNQGSTYNSYVDSPLTDSATSQNYIASPPEFSGIQSVVDVNGACADEGVQISWNSVTNWNDGCSSNCTLRRYEIKRDGTLIQTITDTSQTSYIDTTGNNNVSYDYGVEACNNLDTCTNLGNTLEGKDNVHSTPTLSNSATTAVDINGCTGEGISISWNAPSDWGDNGEGTRSYSLFYSGDGYTTPIASPTSSPFTYDAENGVNYQYRIKATNGCGDVKNYDLSVSAADGVGGVPTLPSPPTLTCSDIDCSLTGILVAFNGVTAWNDNGEGSRRYDLYSSSNNFATPVATNITSPYTYQPGNSNSFTYRVVATNGCSMSSNYSDFGPIADAESAPAFTGIQSVIDTNGCADSTLTISWTDVEGNDAMGWNDGGSGPFPRLYRIFRDGTEIATSPASDGTSSVSDDPPLIDTLYTYKVRAYNMNNCQTSGGTSIIYADYSGMSPIASPAQTTATDITCESATGITVSFNPVTDWGDGGTNSANRKYRLYYSRDGFTNIIQSVSQSVTSLTYKPVDRGLYIYRIVAVNGCGKTKVYSDSTGTADLASCSPTCTMILENNFDSSNNFSETCNGGVNLWTVTSGVGNGGTSAWRCDLSSNLDSTSSLEMTSPSTLTWTDDVKLRFWSSCSLSSDDAGVVEVWTNDSGLWVKIVLLPYPAIEANVPDSITLNCPSTPGGVQPAFQGSSGGSFYEARLDDYLTTSTTQIKIRFKAASGNTSNLSDWVIDDVKLGYGITDSIYFWSYQGSPELGVIKDGTDGYGNEGIFRWEDGGIYQTSEFRIYRSESVSSSDLRDEETATLIHTETDTDASSYEWTTSDGVMSVPVYYYKIYGYKEPCGESDR